MARFRYEKNYERSNLYLYPSLILIELQTTTQISIILTWLYFFIFFLMTPSWIFSYE